MAFLDRYKREIDYGAYLGYDNQLDENIERGFMRAVQNSQPALALQYALLILNQHDDEIKRLSNRVSELESTKATKASTASKTTKKTSAKSDAPKTTEETTETDDGS